MTSHVARLDDSGCDSATSRVRSYCMPVHFGRQRIPPEALGGALRTFVDGRRGVDTPRVFAIDSSKMQLPSQFEREGVLPRNAAAARPLAMCSTLFDTSLDVPYHAIVATHHNERQCLLEGHRQVLRDFEGHSWDFLHVLITFVCQHTS